MGTCAMVIWFLPLPSRSSIRVISTPSRIHAWAFSPRCANPARSATLPPLYECDRADLNPDLPQNEQIILGIMRDFVNSRVGQKQLQGGDRSFQWQLFAVIVPEGCRAAFRLPASEMPTSLS